MKDTMKDKKKRRLAEAEARRTLMLVPEAEPGEAAGAETRPQETEAETETGDAGPPGHPEEMRASLNLRISKKIRLSATARATPAGIVAGAIALSALTVPLIWITRRR